MEAGQGEGQESCTHTLKNQGGTYFLSHRRHLMANTLSIHRGTASCPPASTLHPLCDSVFIESQDRAGLHWPNMDSQCNGLLSLDPTQPSASLSRPCSVTQVCPQGGGCLHGGQ